MTEPREPLSRPSQARSAMTKAKDAADERALMRAQVDKELSVPQYPYPMPPVPARSLTDDQLEWALERLECGDYMKNITDDLGVSKNYLHRRAELDPVFDKRLWRSVAIGVHARIDRADMALEGMEGYTSNNVSRDIARANFAFKRASTLNREKYGERSLISAANITVQLNGPTNDFD